VATAVAILATFGVAAPAPAEPGEDAGGLATLRQRLDQATLGYQAAKVRLANSRQRQAKLTVQLTTIEADVKARAAVVGELAGVAYRGGRAGVVMALLDSDSPDALLDRVAALDAVAANQNEKVRGLLAARARARRTQAAVATEIVQQRRQVQIMAARKKQAEAALVAAGRDGSASNGPGGGGAASARPAPRNPDGSFPDESCRLDDPTTGGCITPRALHALRQAQAAGFRRYVSCFAAQRDGFGGVATGGDRDYGNRLANYFVRNADRLGVAYVIWFQQIWLPSSGWRRYTRGSGDPASEHQNHVHLSVF